MVCSIGDGATYIGGLTALGERYQEPLFFQCFLVFQCCFLSWFDLYVCIIRSNYFFQGLDDMAYLGEFNIIWHHRDRAPGSVSFISWNIRDMGNTIKRNKIFCHLRSFNPDVIFLQETHLKISHHTRLRNTWIGQVYHSNFNHNSRGVAILFRKGAQFDHTKTIKDPNCRFIMLIGKLCNSPIILVNIYGPNWDDPQFFY